MRIIKKTGILMLVLAMFLLTLTSNAYTINGENVKAKNGEEFTVKFNIDEKTALANGQLVFDESKLEFLGSNQPQIQCGEPAGGIVPWVFITMNENNAVECFEFNFKLKESGETTVKLQDCSAVNINGDEYNFSVVVNKKKSFILYCIPVITIICIIIIAIFMKKRKK